MTVEMMWNEIDNLFPFKDSVEAQKFCAILDKYKEMEKEQIEDAELRGKEIIIIKHTEHGGGEQ
jgi:hypothetical protein